MLRQCKQIVKGATYCLKMQNVSFPLYTFLLFGIAIHIIKSSIRIIVGIKLADGAV